jgi:hypothetical protein
MSFYAERHIKKTAKPHRCTGCLEMIPAGSPATYLAGKHDDFWTAYICGDCKVYMDEYDDYFVDDDQRWNEGDIGEARREREAGGAL